MEAKYTEKMTQMTKNIVESMLRLQEINDRTFQTLARQQIETANSCVQAGVRQLKTATESTDPKSYAANQVALATELGELISGHTQKTMEVLDQNKNDLNAWVTSQVKEFMSMDTK